MGTIPSCNFFATPTRLADGLGTKEYPLDIACRLAPAAESSANFGSPVPLNISGFGDRIFNNGMITQKSVIVPRILTR